MRRIRGVHLSTFLCLLPAAGLLAQAPPMPQGQGMMQEAEPLPHPEIPPPAEISAHYPWWIYLAGGLVLAGIVVLIVWLLVGGSKLQALPVKRPLQTALRLLKALRARAEEMAPAAIGHEVSEILRQYYQDRYQIPAPFRTSEELFSAVRLEDEPLRRRHWRERFESLAALYDALSYAPLPVTRSEAIALVETAINKLEDERLNEHAVAA